ncbi:heavy metal transporter [Nocardioides sp. MAH-18]|uniref:Heavy metal transporter n=1 Tax=Nocardioides agri TaxID=2682843 RepID=A0A6L6XX33_9ACTN|nr:MULTISPECIES: heavy metal transporter [unclassified Nocardioides]MBA2956171.1 heavy metal transporter [Nocardioides sp. CGMCC 1.13656]MVQ51016.1 heavy metal transporter [Nocardioides sp. MAH-18]
MMRDTPRTFVGTVVFLLDGPVCAHITDAVHSEVGQLDGVTRCDLDAAAGTLLVTAQEPIDRTDVIAVLDMVGCRVHT